MTAWPDVHMMSAWSGLLWKLSGICQKSYIYNTAVYTTLHGISRHHTVSLGTRAESNLLCVSTDDLNTCRCAHQEQRRISSNPTSLTREHVLIMAVFIDESVSQLSGLLFFTFSKLFKEVSHTLCGILACALYISPCMHTVHRLVIIWSSAHRHF